MKSTIFMKFKILVFYSVINIICINNVAFASEEKVFFSEAPQVHVGKKNPLSDEIVYGNIKTYQEDEIRLIEEDLNNIRKVCFRGKTPSNEDRPVYIATAGSAGNSKTTILEAYLHTKQNIVYLDADQRSLKYMINTYLQDMYHYAYSQKGYHDVALEAYKKWAPGSTFISSKLVNEAFERGFNIAHGTTSTGTHIFEMYENLKAANYKIVLLLCYSSMENRKEACEHRAKVQGFVQNTPQNFAEKALLFPLRFPAYFKYGDTVHLYWTDNFLDGSTLAATFEKGSGLKVHDEQAFAKFNKQYDLEREGTDLKPLQTYWSS